MKNVLIFFLFFLCQQLCGQDIMLLKTNGKVVIGDTSQISTLGAYNLYVQNGVLTERVKVALKNSGEWKDDAFSNTPALDDVKRSIEKQSHLYGMPSADELVREGYELKSMDARLLEQIEWLWQYTIQLAEENKAMKDEIERLKTLVQKDH